MVRRSPGSPSKKQRHFVAAAGGDVAVHAVVGDVEPAALEPVDLGSGAGFDVGGQPAGAPCAKALRRQVPGARFLAAGRSAQSRRRACSSQKATLPASTMACRVDNRGGAAVTRRPVSGDAVHCAVRWLGRGPSRRAAKEPGASRSPASFAVASEVVCGVASEWNPGKGGQGRRNLWGHCSTPSVLAVAPRGPPPERKNSYVGMVVSRHRGCCGFIDPGLSAARDGHYPLEPRCRISSKFAHFGAVIFVHRGRSRRLSFIYSEKSAESPQE